MTHIMMDGILDYSTNQKTPRRVETPGVEWRSVYFDAK
jgi:hypothetical protein